METPEQEAALERLNSSYRTAYEVNDGKPSCIIILVDRTTGSCWHESKANTHSEALDIALRTAQPGAKPLTPAEMAAQSVALKDENAQLRQLVEQLKARGAETAAESEAAPPALTRRRSGA